MKTQLSKPARSKARYTDQYKQEALELWRASGRSAAISNSQNASLALPTENLACRAKPYKFFQLKKLIRDCIRLTNLLKPA